jgi:hypothetical protein
MYKGTLQCNSILVASCLTPCKKFWLLLHLVTVKLLKVQTDGFSIGLTFEIRYFDTPKRKELIKEHFSLVSTFTTILYPLCTSSSQARRPIILDEKIFAAHQA